ncbi:MAG: hypothetical protein J7K36_03635 [Archaeoglobaceae archaeon]|nr:hypothetical protein [Archaeoglobaceae archaeon]
MKKLFRFLKVIYYYLESSYRIGKAKRVQEDDLVYTTKANVQIEVYPGRKPESPYDFIVKFREPGKRERTPAHVHLIVEMYVKYAYNPSLTLKLKEHILTMLRSIKPVNLFPPTLQFFKPQHIEPFKDLDKVGEFTIEFLLVVTELMAIQEKTNYPEGSLTESLYKDFGVKDRFQVIQKAVEMILNKVSPPHRLTADKRSRFATPKLPSATSFIHKPLDEISWILKGLK